MATAATRQEKNRVQRTPTRIDLTPTGLVMEGDFTQVPSAISMMSVIGIFGPARMQYGRSYPTL